MTIRSTMAWVDGLRSRVPTLEVAQLAQRLDSAQPPLLVDIRELQERLEKGAIAGSRHVPRGMLEFWADPAMNYYRDFFTADADIVVYCAGGGRSVLAALALLEMGYLKVWHLDGGFAAWSGAGRPVGDVAATSKWQRRS